MQNLKDRKIKKVAIIGGTHGNEFTGVYLVKKWLQDASKIKRDTLEVTVIHANSRATDAVRRYTEQDLNRSFLLEDLEKEPENYEQKRAQELNNILGPKGSEELNFDFIIDLHSTPTASGMCLIIDNSDALSFTVAESLLKTGDDVRIYDQTHDGQDDEPYITSVVPTGFVVEVGAVTHGVLDSRWFRRTENMIYSILDFLDAHNMGDNNYIEKDVVVYKHFKNIDFPRTDDGEVSAMIHQDMMSADFKKIKNGDPLFINFDNKTINFACDDGEEYYPVFINSPSYYEKGVAMELTKKVTRKIQTC